MRASIRARRSAKKARLENLNSNLKDENAGLRREIAAAERQLQIELATHGNLSGQIRTLAEENALLKEDLAFFQTLMASGSEPAVSASIAFASSRTPCLVNIAIGC